MKQKDLFPPTKETKETKEDDTYRVQEPLAEIPKVSTDILESAWEVLSKALTQTVSDSIKFHASLLKIPQWQLVCGLLVQSWKSGNLTAPDLDPSWQAGEVIQRESQKCPECGKYFIPPNRGMEFCSDECGKADLHKKWLKRDQESKRIQALRNEPAEEDL